MKITDFALIFLLAFLPASIGIDVDQHRQIEAESWKQLYDEYICTACEDATVELLRQTGQASQQNVFEGAHKSSKDVVLNLDHALDRFFETVYINFGIDNNKILQDAMKEYLPVQMVVAYDGLYVHARHNVYNEATGKMEPRESWTSKIPYSYYDKGSEAIGDERIVNFTLDKLDDEKSDNIRRETIIRLIQDQLEYYTGRNNYLAEANGLGYVYNIPYISEDSWNNTINDICFIAFLQGIVIPGTDQSYSTYGFGGTKLSLGQKFYGVMELQYGKCYHRQECDCVVNGMGGNIEATFNSRKEAARSGYGYCGACRP